MAITLLLIGLALTLLSHWVEDTSVEYFMLLGSAIAVILSIVFFILGA